MRVAFSGSTVAIAKVKQAMCYARIRDIKLLRPKDGCIEWTLTAEIKDKVIVDVLDEMEGKL